VGDRARPARLTEGPKKGEYRVGMVGKNSGTQISRVHLAEFMLGRLTADTRPRTRTCGRCRSSATRTGARMKAIVVDETGSEALRL
jgi:hypothetical protein